ncbi:FAD-dependent oxidoreductase [Candidatus Dependentiae bacterium]
MSFGVKFMLLVAVSAVGTYVFIKKPWKKEAQEMKLSVKDINVDDKTHPVVIIGGGPAGLTAAIYLSQARFSPILLEGKMPGGALTQSHAVQNWPGEKEIRGSVLMDQMREHALHAGAKIESKEVVSVDFSSWPLKIVVKDILSGKEEEIKALSCFIATGSAPNFLGIPGERGADGYFGKGVSTCAVCDGGLFRGKTVAIVGGGDSAIVEAEYLSSLVKQVHIFVRKDSFRAADGVKDRVLAQDNVKVHFNTEVQKINGDGKKVTGVALKNNVSGQESEIVIDGLFLAIGSHPNTDIFCDHIECDDYGYIVLKDGQRTSVESVFAAGDVADPVYKQAITSSGDACKAALQIMSFLRSVGVATSKVEAVEEKEVEKKEEKAKKEPEPEKVEVKDGPKVEVEAEKEEPSVSSEVEEQDDATGEIIKVENASNFRRMIKDSSRPAVVDFYATWCMPCKLMHPIFEAAAQSFAGRADFYSINIDEVGEIAREHGIQGIPTFLFLDPSGEEQDRVVGAQSAEDLTEKIESLL